jgi:hypothetical protein
MKHLALFCLLPSLALFSAPPAAPKTPVVPAQVPPEIQTLQPGVKLTLLAEHPDLATPTGIDVDENGSIWLVSCHTHFRPEGYKGPQHDEILVFDKNGKNRRVFYDRTEQTMHLKLGPDGWVYLAQHDRILRVKDTNGAVRRRPGAAARCDRVRGFPSAAPAAQHPDRPSPARGPHDLLRAR